MTSKIFDKYQVVRRIAVGGMGEVFLAKQTGIPGFERPVILKALLAGAGAPQELVTRFLDEARLVATLNHPNVVSVFEAGLWSGTFYMAMEYIAGWNLVQLRREAEESGRGLPYGLSARIVHDAALGLDHAHHAVTAGGRAQHIVHRDVSPHNIMVRRDGITKVVDFGVAWALNRDSKTQTGAVVGKLSYMAPEQLRGELTDARSNQFALGIVLWELLTGQRLYQGKNEMEVANRVLTARVAHPSDVGPAVPRELGDIAVRMLAGPPERRFARCQDVSHALEAAAAAKGLDFATSSLEAFLEPLLPVPAERVESSGGDFVVQLKGEPSVVPTDSVIEVSVLTTDQRVPRRRRWPIAVALGVTVVAAGGTWLATRSELPPVVVVDATPPEVKPAPEPEPEPEPAPPPAPVAAPVKAPKARSPKKPAPEPPKPAEGTRYGFLTIATDPWSRVTLDGKMIGSTPLSKVQVAAGDHDLLLENDEAHLKTRKRIKVAADETLKLDLSLSP